MARKTSTARVREPAPVIDLVAARSRRASRATSPSASSSSVVSCAITATILRLPVTTSGATATPATTAATAVKTSKTSRKSPKEAAAKPRSSVRQRFTELRTALADGWEIVQPIFARPLWSAADDSTTAFNFVLRRSSDTRLVTVPEGRTVERFIRDRQLTVDYRR